MNGIYIHNTRIRDGVCVYNYDNTDEIFNKLRRYTEKYTEVVFILDFDDEISYGLIDRLIMALKMINDGTAIDITLRCDKLLREYDFYDTIRNLIKRD